MALFTTIASLPATAQEPYTFADPSPSVELLDVGDLSDGEVGSSGIAFLLVDHQLDFRGPTIERTYHYAWRVADELGVQEGAQVSIDFDPEFEELVLHSVVLRRGDRVIDQLDPERIEVLQRETELEARIYDGTRTLLLFAQDVRRGDVLEHAYTLRGQNPVFGEHVAEWLYLSGGGPVRHLRQRVLWPDGKALFWRGFRTELEPEVTQYAGYRELVWERRDVPALDFDDTLPGWFDPLPYVQLSDMDDWADVVAWGLPLYTVPAELSPALLEEVERIRAAGEGEEERVLAALRFVQDEVRYLGIMLGPRSHRPTAPDAVLERRFGDCKDKTLLLCTLLSALGIEAAPAFVNSETRERVDELLPTPLAFDHCIVRARVDGEDHWLDPTTLYERGGLARYRRSWPGRALVVSPASLELTRVPPLEAEEPGIHVRQVLRLGGEADEPVELEVTHVFRGDEADSMRYAVSSNRPDELARYFAENLRDLYTGIEPVGAPTVTDDEAANRLTYAARYTVPRFWTRDGLGWEAELYAQDVNYELELPTLRQRSMPLGIAHPVHVTMEIEAWSNEGWDIESEESHVRTPALALDFAAEAEDDVLRLSYTLRSLSDHVVAADVPRHLEGVERMYEVLSFPLRRGPLDASASRKDDFTSAGGDGAASLWIVLAFAGAWSLFCLLLAGVVFVWNPRLRGRTDDDEGPRGASGWLAPVWALAPLALLVSAFFALGTLAELGPAAWDWRTDPDSNGYHFLAAPLILFQLGAGIAVFALALLLLATFVPHRRAFPLVALAFLVTFVVSDGIVTAGHALLDAEPGQPAGLGFVVRTLSLSFLALVAAGYLVRSRRVRATFVE